MTDTYQTLKTSSLGDYREKGSKFFAYAQAVYNDEEVRAALEAIQKEHPKARHLCYAYRLGLDGNNFRANDDGEPSGSAGKPILGQIDSFGLSNVLIGVIRYFGGTKLGVGGLIHAYKTSAADALQQAEIVERFLQDVYRIKFPYDKMSAVMNFIKKTDLEIKNQSYELNPFLDVAIRKSKVEGIKSMLESYEWSQKLEGMKFDFIRSI